MFKTRRMNALLAPLAAVVGGKVAGGELTGSYDGYAVVARPKREDPLGSLHASEGPAPRGIDMFELTLAGVRGKAIWNCQSSPGSLAGDVLPRLTDGRFHGHLGAADFKFEGVTRENAERMGARLAKAVGVPIDVVADKELRERLIAGGLFAELAPLRWGPNAYMPKVRFKPPASEILEVYKHSPAFARVDAKASERLRAAGLGDYESVLDQQMADADTRNPGELVLEVEVGKAKVPSPKQFRQLLDHAVRIAQINAEANPPTLTA